MGQDMRPPDLAQNPELIRGIGGPPKPPLATSGQPSPKYRHDLCTRAMKSATMINTSLDLYIHILLFIFIGLPIYFINGYAMPAHLSWSVLSYFAASSISPNYKRFLHPVIASSALTILGIWLLALAHGSLLKDALRTYTTKTDYIALLGQLPIGHASHIPFPGAGDIFNSLIHISIIALAIPMFQYRAELLTHIFSILIPTLLIATISLFSYPPLCHALGISPPLSLSFASRSLTLALATPTLQNIGGDVQLGAVLCIMTGIFGSLVGLPLLKWLPGISEDDYVTKGVTMGCNTMAIGTTLLLETVVKAASLSSLSMALFGMVMVGLSSIGPLASAVGHVAGLNGTVSAVVG
ncbi:hypothetical protein ACLMJK_004954 [Lecanora helva]